MDKYNFQFNSRLWDFSGGEEFIEVADYAALPTTGETSKIYVTLDNNKLYRWTGSTYVELSGVTIDANPVNGSVNAVSSNGVFNALATKQPILVSGTNIKTINNSSILGSGNITLDSWNKLGNAGTNPDTDFIGTTDNQDLVFKRNNVEFFRNRIAVNRANRTELFLPQGIDLSFARSDGSLLGINTNSNVGYGNNTLSLWGVNGMNFSVHNGDFTWYNSSSFITPRMTLKNTTGNFLIGTTTDGGRVYIKAQGALSTDNVFRIRNSADNGDLFNVLGNGNVLIGTTTDAGYKLDVNGTSRVQKINISAIPTSSSGLVAGDVWNDAGTLKIV